MKTLKKIIRVIIATIIILIVALNVYNFINLKILNKDLSTIFGYSTLEVVSGSMKPTIEVGELIVIDTNEKNYKKDDIVTFYDINGSFVTHRIVSIDDDKMITKGDNNDSKDDATDVDKIVGKYVCKIPFLGAILTVLQKPIILMLILIIGILYSYLVSTEETKEKKIRKPKHSVEERKAYAIKSSNEKKNDKKLQKQLLKEQKQKQQRERKQIKEDFKEFKKWKEQQRKEQEQREFLEFRRMKEEQRKEQENKKQEELQKRLEEEHTSKQQKISKNTNSNEKYKPRKNNKSNKNNKKYQNKKNKSNKNYNYNQKNQNYKKRR